MADVSAVTSTQTVDRRTGGQAAQDKGGDSQGWKYVTVQEGDIIYTYIVIGKNMEVLIGKSAAPEKEDKDKQAAGASEDAAGSPAQAKGAGQAAGGVGQADAAEQTTGIDRDKPVSFLTDQRMLGLTGHHQQKMREVLEKLAEHIRQARLAAAEQARNTAKS